MMSQPTLSPTFASVLWARAHHAECRGTFHCHWCGAPAGTLWRHDDDPPVPFQRSRTTALHPGEPYVCAGCWIWRHQRSTIRFLAGGFRDGQTACNHSLLFSMEGAWAIETADDQAALLGVLLKPPCQFCLMLRHGEGAPINLLQLGVLNEHALMTAGIELGFTVNNVRHHYTICELAEALRGERAGREGGTRFLADWLGKHHKAPVSTEETEAKRGRGRPKNMPAADLNPTTKLIRASGVA